MMGVVEGSLGVFWGKLLRGVGGFSNLRGAETPNSWEVTAIKAPSPSSTNDISALRIGVDGLLGAYVWGPFGGLFVGGVLLGSI